MLMTKEIIALDVYRRSAFYNEWAKKSSCPFYRRRRYALGMSLIAFKLSINRGDF